MTVKILGISAYYHDSSAALVIDGEIVEAVHEERFTRKKHDHSFPARSVEYILTKTGMVPNDLDAVVFYEKPYLKFERLLETYHEFAPRGFKSFASAMPVWIKEKVFMTGNIKKEMAKFGDISKVKFFYSEHHLSHAAGAFFPSPFEEAAILTLDGVGERATSLIGCGKGNSIEVLKELHFPHSIGLLYSAFTYYCGFKVNSGEYKLMGLAPYGDPDSERTALYEKKIRDEIVDVKNDGSIIMNMDYFDYATGLKMINEKKWEELFGLKVKSEKEEYTQEYMDMALAIQRVTEDIVMKMAVNAKESTGSENLVLAGGVALNSVANGKILNSGLFKNIWIQPAAGDAGGSVGAALAQYYIGMEKERHTDPDEFDGMKGAYLGPEYSDGDILTVLKKYGVSYNKYEDFNELAAKTASLLNEGAIAGWFQGRMEYGPRALGSRSILGDARRADMQKRMNLKIKFREGFRPFAPSVIEEDIKEFFDINIPSPYMLFVIPVTQKRRKPIPEGYYDLPLYDRLYHQRSDIPAVTHIDYSARIQSVSKKTNPKYWTVINEFKKLTGYGVIVNTSFNVRGEPIVCTPDDAFSCFMRTEMDHLVMGSFLLDKKDMKGLDMSKFNSDFESD
jgi:carbamoyltransferase